MAKQGSAYWLLDEIACGPNLPAVSAEEFQVRCLIVNADQSAILTCDDGNDRVVLTKKIEFTDFPLSEGRFYFTGNTILLPSEY